MSFSWSRLADYFTAVAALDAANDVEKQRAIAILLGLDEKGVEAKAEAPRPEPVAPPIVDRPATAPAPVVPAPAPSDAAPPRRQRSRPRLDVTLTPSSPEKRTRPAWIEHVLPLAPPRKRAARLAVPVPLLPRRTSRAILSTAMATDRETNAIDLDAVVETAARGLRVRRVPRRIVPSLSRGIQLLIDRGPSSEPFLADQELLAEQIRVVAGRDRVQVLQFDPSQAFFAGAGPRYEWIDYFDVTPRPQPGVTVVLLSDLGITSVPLESSVTPEEWRRFLTRIRARGNPLLAFVPYGRSRWPASLRGLAVMVPWDRRTNIQLVRRVLGSRIARRRIPR